VALLAWPTTAASPQIMGGGSREGLIEFLRSWQLPHKLNVGGEEGALLAWPTTAASPQITMEIHISNWTHKFQNRTGLDAKTNSELYKSNRVCSACGVYSKKACIATLRVYTTGLELHLDFYGQLKQVLLL
jgi:hypothetical protein